MKIVLVVLLLITDVAVEASPEVASAPVVLHANDAEKLLRRIQACNTEKCWSESFSQESSKLEKNRTKDWLKAFKIQDSKKWTACKLKLRHLGTDEVCFAQPQDPEGQNEVRIFFKYEEQTWRLKHLSLPSPVLGW